MIRVRCPQCKRHEFTRYPLFRVIKCDGCGWLLGFGELTRRLVPQIVARLRDLAGAA